jgi:hypothetical protein
MLNRGKFLGSTAAAGAAVAGGMPLIGEAAALDLPRALPEGLRANAVRVTLPGKKPLIKLSYRPPNYESPIQYFRTAITPNDEFFVLLPVVDPGSRREDLEDLRRRRWRQRPGRIDHGRSQEDAGA